MSVRATRCDLEKVGKKIKGTKRKYTWEFEIDGKKHIIEFFASLSGKKKIVHNKKDIHEENKMTTSF